MLKCPMGVIHIFMLCQKVVLLICQYCWLNEIYMELILAFMCTFMYFNYRFKVYSMLTQSCITEKLFFVILLDICTVNKVVIQCLHFTNTVSEEPTLFKM